MLECGPIEPKAGGAGGGPRRERIQQDISKILPGSGRGQAQSPGVGSGESLQGQNNKGESTVVVKYDPRPPQFSQTLRACWKTLTEDPTMKKVFPAPPMVCYQRMENQKERQVKSKLPSEKRCSERRGRVGYKPCGLSVCPLCTQLVDKTCTVIGLTCSATGERVEIAGKVTCSSTNIIYCVTCRRAGRVCKDRPHYVHICETVLLTDFREHLGTITKPCINNTVAPVGALQAVPFICRLLLYPH